MDKQPHPLAKIFAPVVFSTLALLTVGFSFDPSQQQPEPASAVSSSK